MHQHFRFIKSQHNFISKYVTTEWLGTSSFSITIKYIKPFTRNYLKLSKYKGYFKVQKEISANLKISTLVASTDSILPYNAKPKEILRLFYRPNCSGSSLNHFQIISSSFHFFKFHKSIKAACSCSGWNNSMPLMWVIFIRLLENVFKFNDF